MTVAFNAITEIPPELPLRIPHLHTLDLSHNLLVTLPESFGLQFHIRTLILRNNKLKSLPESFVHLVKLEKIDLSNNMLKELPQDIGKMEAIQKINVSGNKLRQLPLSLGASSTLVLIMAQRNRMYEPPQAICDEGSEATLTYLRKLYKNSHPVHERRPLTPLNEFPRIRGNQLHSAVPNPQSANMQYIQSQTHTTNTPSRIKTPLLPPLGASSLDSDVLKDKVIGQ
jgi:Leucine-rich repeat (LRR) protein